MKASHQRRLATLEASAPTPPRAYDLSILSYDELVALAMSDAGKPIPAGQDIELIHAKLKAHHHG